MSVNKDFFQPDRDFNYDFESTGRPARGERRRVFLKRLCQLIVPSAVCSVACT